MGTGRGFDSSTKWARRNSFVLPAAARPYSLSIKGTIPGRTTMTSGSARTSSDRGLPISAHSGSANYLFLDGHVATLKWEQAVVDMYPDKVVLIVDDGSYP